MSYSENERNDADGENNESVTDLIDPSDITVDEKIFATVKNEEYIRFKVLYERIVFKEKLTSREKTEKIIIMALNLLDEKVSEIVKKGRTFTSPQEILKK